MPGRLATKDDCSSRRTTLEEDSQFSRQGDFCTILACKSLLCGYDYVYKDP